MRQFVSITIIINCLKYIDMYSSVIYIDVIGNSCLKYQLNNTVVFVLDWCT